MPRRAIRNPDNIPKLKLYRLDWDLVPDADTYRIFCNGVLIMLAEKPPVEIALPGGSICNIVASDEFGHTLANETGTVE